MVSRCSSGITVMQCFVILDHVISRSDCTANFCYRYLKLYLMWKPLASTVYPKKYAHGFCFAVLCCGYTLTDFPISIRLTSLALWQSNDCPSASKATLMNMDKYFMWIHYERLHNHNKAKHNKTVCIFLGIYCIWQKIFTDYAKLCFILLTLWLPMSWMDHLGIQQWQQGFSRKLMVFSTNIGARPSEKESSHYINIYIYFTQTLLK